MLAAGRGERLRPLTATTPKILVSVADRPLLAHQLEYLSTQGVTEVALNAHYQSARVREFVANWSGPPTVRLYEEPRLLGTAGALSAMCDFLDTTAVCLYGDVLTNARLRDLLALHRHADAAATIGVHLVADVTGKGVVEVDGAGRVLSFVEKAAVGARRALVNAGVYALEPEFVARTAAPGLDFGHDVWPRALRNGTPIAAFLIDGYVWDIGTYDALRRASEALAARVGRPSSGGYDRGDS